MARFDRCRRMDADNEFLKTKKENWYYETIYFRAEKSNGWWCSIFPADIDEDGDMDYFLGNAGTNLQFKATEKEPVELTAGDFNNDGVLDPIVTYFIKGKNTLWQAVMNCWNK